MPTRRAAAQPESTSEGGRKPGLLAPFAALDRRIWLLALARCINTMGFSLVMPFMAIHIVEDRGATGALYGAIYLVAGLVAALGQGIAGELSDRIGRRKVMVSGLATRALNLAALGAAVLVSAPIWVIGALVITNGLLRSQFEPAASAAVTELAPPEERVAAYGLQRIGLNVGWAVGPALGGFLASHSYGTLFFVAAPATLLTIFAVLPVKDRPRLAVVPQERPKLELRAALEVLREHRIFAAYLVLVLLGSVLTVQIFSTLSLYTSSMLGFTKADVGLLYTVNGLAVVLFQVPAVAIARPWGMRRALVVGALLYAVAYLVFGSSVTFAGMAFGMAVLTAGEVIFAPALSDTAATLGDPARLGRAFGLFGLMQTLGISLGPLVGGIAFDHLRTEPLLLWGALAAGMVLLGIAYSRFGRREGVFERMQVG
ncbi:MAG TPA: MFS transporter [Vulgatibacter sp.]|nr:MFS transporter [Vulgatibacter sp.]